MHILVAIDLVGDGSEQASAVFLHLPDEESLLVLHLLLEHSLHFLRVLAIDRFSRGVTDQGTSVGRIAQWAETI